MQESEDNSRVIFEKWGKGIHGKIIDPPIDSSMGASPSAKYIGDRSCP